LKPFGLADFTEFAVLQGACGRTLQLRTLRLASSANSTIAQFRLNEIHIPGAVRDVNAQFF
jgi:hypothetical protein